MIRSIIQSTGLVIVLSGISCFNQILAIPYETRSDSSLQSLGGIDSVVLKKSTRTKPSETGNKVQISGYTQFQYRCALGYKGAINDSSSSTNFGKYNFPVGNFAGGTFTQAVGDQFQVRRARLKITYSIALTQWAMQVDGTPWSYSATSSGTLLGSPGMQIKEASLRFAEPWLRSFAIKAGVFDRPFGFEVNYSAKLLESPEKSRIIQTLMPNEQDLGLQLEYVPACELPWPAKLFNFKIGAFNGNSLAVETDDFRDLMGRFGMALPFGGKEREIDVGISGYLGHIQDRSDSLYTVSNGIWSGSAGNRNNEVDRKYYGADGQVCCGKIPLIGKLRLRGEVIYGKQPDSSGTSISQSNNITTVSSIYERKFLGYYAMLVQDLDPLTSQIVLKYDVYDPNTEISGTKVTMPADVMYTTLGVGAVYHWDTAVSLTAYWDIVRNEKTAVKYYTVVDNANVFTFRIQYAF